MKTYSSPNAELVALNVTDIITLSAPDSLADADDTQRAPNSWFGNN